MNDGFTWWLIVLGIAIGVGLVYVFVVRLPRMEADVDASEVPVEADWISRNIETYGGVAPQPLVEEVLELHRQYLVTGPTPLPPVWHPGTNGGEANSVAEEPLVAEPRAEAERDSTAEPASVAEPAPGHASDSEQGPPSSDD